MVLCFQIERAGKASLDKFHADELPESFGKFIRALLQYTRSNGNLFDLPLFIKEESFDFADNLCRSLGINLETGIDGVPLEEVDDWLVERFGGVVGYVAELFLEISKVVQYHSTCQT
eukprot:TRINITY_DN49633_c1_g1_i1.p1 TRINITY_DN49633_c1_g1~~TRINITY_DN49633_c1_g1_i1.p1  ORF type:complete len:117 (+),score=31.90 TRINITY_DN49633_c1_g1_i1:72-422(+)